jgi:hypothetical protein
MFRGRDFQHSALGSLAGQRHLFKQDDHMPVPKRSQEFCLALIENLCLPCDLCGLCSKRGSRLAFKQGCLLLSLRRTAIVEIV